MKFKNLLRSSILLTALVPFAATAEESPERGMQREWSGGPVYAAAPESMPRSKRVGDPGLAALVDREAAAQGVPPAIARAVVRIESGWNAHITGRAGEIGLMQIKHDTARAMGFTGSRSALYDPATNIRFGIRYLAEAYRLSGGDLCRTVAKYQGGLQAGPGSAMARKYCAQARNIMASN